MSLSTAIEFTKKVVSENITGAFMSSSDYEVRSKYVNTVSWAIPSNEALKSIKDFVDGRTLIEIGAGLGFWSALLAKHYHIDVQAHDVVVEQDRYCAGVEYFPVTRHDDTQAAVDVILQNKDFVLMMIWPSYDEQWSADYLNMINPSSLIYVGEYAGGCTGCDEFHTILDNHYIASEHSCAISQWKGIHDTLTCYDRIK